MGRLPSPGESVEAVGHRFTVTELDGRRIARVLLSPLPPDDGAAGGGPTAAEPTGPEPTGAEPTAAER
jgi:putative hemolysin